MPPIRTPVTPVSFIYAGIDPGASGGLVSLHYREGKLIEMNLTVMPESLVDTAKWFQEIAYTHGEGDCFAVIEKVWGYIGGPGTGSGMFKFGQSYGILLMALTMSGIPFEEVAPQRWQKALAIPPKGKDESKTQWKNRLKIKAEKLFPQCRPTLKTADALLIAEFCRRKRTGTL